MLGRPRSEQDVADLYANTPPPSAFFFTLSLLVRRGTHGGHKAWVYDFNEICTNKLVPAQKQTAHDAAYCCAGASFKTVPFN